MDKDRRDGAVTDHPAFPASRATRADKEKEKEKDKDKNGWRDGWRRTRKRIRKGRMEG